MSRQWANPLGAPLSPVASIRLSSTSSAPPCLLRQVDLWATSRVIFRKYSSQVGLLVVALCILVPGVPGLGLSLRLCPGILFLLPYTELGEYPPQYVVTGYCTAYLPQFVQGLS